MYTFAIYRTGAINHTLASLLNRLVLDPKMSEAGCERQGLLLVVAPHSFPIRDEEDEEDEDEEEGREILENAAWLLSAVESHLRGSPLRIMVLLSAPEPAPELGATW